MARIKLLIVIGLMQLVAGLNLANSQTNKFISFSVQPDAGRVVIIQWNLIPAADTLSFEVERSRDSIKWETVSHSPAQLSHKYYWVDKNPGDGLIYYRVRQINAVDNYSSTQTRWVQIGKTGELYIWPNPVNNVLHVKTPFAKGSMEIVDAGGRLMQKISITDLITDVPIGHFAMGIYFIRVKSGNQIIVEKFVKGVIE
ncbi:MAG TPA: T9SS type A sorting domain-containing protein [Chitinophagaceae bacterium]|nr:T9SS type A sorting domain-containing protein [Chitinophagaceae bacterium]